MYGILKVSLAGDGKSFVRRFVRVQGRPALYPTLERAERQAAAMHDLARSHDIIDIDYRARKYTEEYDI